MKKLALVLLAGFSFATAANAQSIQFGVKAGANLANVSGSGTQGVSTSTLVSFNGGVFLGLGFTDNLFLQPELVYSGQGFKETVTYSGTTYTGTQTEGYFNVPILVKYKLPVGLYFETGPQVGILISAKAKSGGASQDDKAQFKSTDFAWAVGAGFQIPATQLGIDVRYNIGLANIADNSGGGSGSVKNGVFQVGLTYVLFNSGGK
jgi:hypothetical protein